MNDPYLNDCTVVCRLYEEFKKHGKLIIGFDFDNTIYDYHKKGFTFHRITELWRRCNKQGHIIVIVTGNNDYDLIKEHLDRYDLHFDYINYSPVATGTKKVYTNILLDDRAGLLSATQILRTTLNIIDMEK